MSEYIRYKAAANLIETGQIKKMEEVFTVARKTRMHEVLHINFGRLNRAIKNPENFRIKELVALAAILKVNPKHLVDIAFNQSFKKRGRPKKHPR